MKFFVDDPQQDAVLVFVVRCIEGGARNLDAIADTVLGENSPLCRDAWDQIKGALNSGTQVGPVRAKDGAVRATRTLRRQSTRASTSSPPVPTTERR